MELRGARVLLLGGSGLVGLAIARRVLARRPARLVITARTRREAEAGERELRAHVPEGTELALSFGDLFVSSEFKDRARSEILASADDRARLLDDLFGELQPGLLERAYLYDLLRSEKPAVVIDCVNTATAIAYRNLFASVEEVRRAAREGRADLGDLLDAHLAILYLPQLIRHVQVILEGMKVAGTRAYVKVGTSGTGGMGLNVPFTHSEQRPSQILLAKAGVAGAHTLLLYLMARTPGAPAVKEVKPTAAIAWKRIAAGPIERNGRPIPLYDATEPVPLERAFEPEVRAWEETGQVLEAVYVDTGENGLFSRDEFEAISSLGMMELVTPEEIADAVLWEIEGYPTGHDVVAALDAASFGPTYRGGVLRESALRTLEALETKLGRRSVAFEILGPPRLSKLLYEAAILERVYASLQAVARMEPAEAAVRTRELLERDRRLTSEIISIGIPILWPDGKRLLRGPEVKVRPPAGRLDLRSAARGWVDLRPDNWGLWRERVRRYLKQRAERPGLEQGSQTDADVAAAGDDIRPGSLVAWIFRVEDDGERMKR